MISRVWQKRSSEALGEVIYTKKLKNQRKKQSYSDIHHKVKKAWDASEGVTATNEKKNEK